MATMAIDVVDLNWRVLQSEEKPLTRRGYRLFRCNPRRARGDNCYDHERRGEGPRVLALQRSDHALVEELDEVEGSESNPALSPAGYRNCATRWRKSRKKDDVRMFIEQERTEMLALEDELRRAREQIPDIFARRRFLQELISFLEEHLSPGDLVGKRFLVGQRLELAELEVLMRY